MYEARHRIDFLPRLYGDEYKLPEQPACELGYLQLRLICEIIALACLAVHGDTPGARSAKMRSAHEADYILNSLERLHDNFYPQPGAERLCRVPLGSLYADRLELENDGQRISYRPTSDEIALIPIPGRRKAVSDFAVGS
jgi:hypothetical protein